MDMEQTETIINQQQYHNKHHNKEVEQDFNGAVFIGKDGNEIPITEAMIQNACNNLHDAWNSSGSDVK